MHGKQGPRKRGRWWQGAALCAAGLMTGCQSYRAAPIDLEGYGAAMAGRASDTEDVAAFAARLEASGARSTTSFDLSDGLDLAEAEVLALFYNPDLRLARLDAGVSAATAEHAGLWEDPVLGFDGEEILTPAGPFQWGLTLGLTLPVSGRLAVERDLAGAEHEAVLRAVVDREWALRFEVRRAWARWTIAAERLALLDGVIARVDRITELTDRLESGGELARIEARLFRVEALDRRAARKEAELEASMARLALLGLLGLPPEAAVGLVPGLPQPAQREAEDSASRLIAHNTALAVRRAEHQAAEQALRLAVREQFPDVAIGAGYGTEGHDDRLLLGVSIPIPVLSGNRGEIARARAEREAKRAAAEVAYERIVWRLSAARASMDAAQARLDAFRAGILPLIAEQSAEVEQLASLGEVDTLLLLEAVGREFDAKSALLEIRLAGIEAGLTIEELLGPDELGGPAPWQSDGADRADEQDQAATEGGGDAR